MNKEAVLFHIPHASAVIPEAFSGDFLVDLTENIRHMTDWYTDELFDFGFGERIVFPVSRLVCDPERFREDSEESMAGIGMGAVYTHGFDLRRIRETSAERREEILREFYDPHHQRLEEKTKTVLMRYGTCLIADCHSFSPIPLPYEKDPLRPDICIGTDGFHTPEWLSGGLAEAFRLAGYTVVLNRPFAGTMVPLSYYGKDPRVLSVMIEVNRGLYLTKDGRKNRDFSEISGLLRRVLLSAVLQRKPG